MTGPTLSNELADMAESAGTAWQASRAASREAIARALDAGDVLLRARATVPHGHWWPFLQRAGIPERQAQRLMQLARANLNADTVSALGGVKATLAALGRFRLPEPGNMVLVDNLGEPRAYGFIWPSAEHDGHFNIAGAADDFGDGVRFMCRPIAGPFVFAALWLIVPPADGLLSFLTTPEDEDLARLLSGFVAAEASSLHGAAP